MQFKTFKDLYQLCKKFPLGKDFGTEIFSIVISDDYVGLSLNENDVNHGGLIFSVIFLSKPAGYIRYASGFPSKEKSTMLPDSTELPRLFEYILSKFHFEGA